MEWRLESSQTSCFTMQVKETGGLRHSGFRRVLSTWMTRTGWLRRRTGGSLQVSLNPGLAKHRCVTESAFFTSTPPLFYHRRRSVRHGPAVPPPSLSPGSLQCVCASVRACVRVCVRVCMSVCVRVNVSVRVYCPIALKPHGHAAELAGLT